MYLADRSNILTGPGRSASSAVPSLTITARSMSLLSLALRFLIRYPAMHEA